MDAGPTISYLAVVTLAALLLLGSDRHLGLDGYIGLDGHFLLSGQLNRLGDLYGGDVPLASLATEESEFTMPSSEGFWIFFFFFGDILMEMDERKNQLLLSLANQYQILAFFTLGKGGRTGSNINTATIFYKFAERFFF